MESRRDPAMASRRLVVLTAALALAIGLLAAPASADTRPPPFNQPHGHVLLIGADVDWVGGAPPYRINSYKRCVELAGGRSVPLHAHHDRVHFGRAGQALAAAGHLVVPLNIIPGIDSCADLSAAGLPFPPQP
jgi:hypothetical protein